MSEHFDFIYQRASERKGGEAALERLLVAPKSKQQVALIPDDRFLAEMTKKVFQSGFVWRVIEQKWPEFEQAFFGFNVEKVLLMPDEMLEQKASDPKIVRNYKKVMTVRENALMIKEVSEQNGSFAEFVNSFDSSSVIQLWDFLKKRGARLGGNTGPYMLRALGVDTFLIFQDVEDYFRKHELISGGVSSKRSLIAINRQFVQWQQQSNRSLQEISQLVAFSWGGNHRH